MTLPNLIAPAGALPVNTAGGNLAEGFVHGIGLVLEAVRQIRGTSPNQVPGADVSLLLGGPVAPLVSATVFGSAATVLPVRCVHHGSLPSHSCSSRAETSRIRPCRSGVS